MASSPETRMIAIAPAPEAVAKATIESFLIITKNLCKSKHFFWLTAVYLSDRDSPFTIDAIKAVNDNYHALLPLSFVTLYLLWIYT